MALRCRALGSTDVAVSEIGFGGWAIGGARAGHAYGPTDDAASRSAIAEALELGCNLFDTADSYGHGHSEELLGQALRGRRAEVVLATKAGLDFYRPTPEPRFEPAYLRFALHQSLRRLKTDYVDLFQLHNPPPGILFEPPVREELESLRAAGKVRWLGVSAATAEDGLAAVEAGWVDAVQITYNLLAPEAAAQLFAAARGRGVGILAREPLANGMLTGKYGPSSRFAPGDIRGLWGEEAVAAIARQVNEVRPYCREGETLAQLALRFALEAPEVSAVLVGAKTREQVRENLDAAKSTSARGERSMDETPKPVPSAMTAEPPAPGLPPLGGSAVASLIPFPAPVQEAIQGAVLAAKPERATDIWYEDKTTGDVHVMGHGMQWQLNDTASVVWKLLDGREVKAIVEELGKKFPKHEGAEVVSTTVEFLLQAHSSGLVELFPEPEKAAK